MQVKNIRKNYTVLPSDKFLFVHTAVPITITVPKQIPNDVSFIILGSGTESSNNITIAYPNQSDTVISTDNSITVITHNGNDLYSVNSAGAGGGGGDTGWTLTPGVYSRLNADLGITTESIGSSAENLDFLINVDTSISDVTEDLTVQEGLSINLIKNIKVSGPFDLILQSTAGFSDGTNELIIVDSAILFYDVLAGKWQILYNNEWKTKTVDISSAEILAMGDTIIELLPVAGAGNYYEIGSGKLKLTFGTTAYDCATTGDIEVILGGYVFATSTSILTSEEDVVADLFRTDVKDVQKMNQALLLTTNSGNNPTLGDGTLQAIIKYKLLTF